MAEPKFIPQTFQAQSPAIASYDYQDIVSNLGYVTFYPSVFENSAADDFGYFLIDRQLQTSNTNGKLNLKQLYYFPTSKFNKSATVNGTAYLSGYADWTSGAGLVITAKLDVVSGTAVAAGVGTDTYESLGEVTKNTDAGTYTLYKTIYTDDYITDLDFEAYGDGVAYFKIVWHYADGTAEEIFTDSSGAYNDKTATNPNLTKRVASIKIWLNIAVSALAKLKNAIATNQLVTGVTTTSICADVTSQTKTADGAFLLQLPLTKTHIAQDAKLNLTIKAEGGVGWYVLDPTNQYITDYPTLKFDLPFELNI